MSALAILKLWLAGTAFRIGGWSAPGGALMAALEDPREDVRVAAGYLLARAGARAVPLLGARLGAAEGASEALAVLASIDDPRADELLRRLAGGPDAARAEAATRALEARRGGQPAGGV